MAISATAHPTRRILLVSSWILASLLGFGAIDYWSSKVGAAAPAPSRWPLKSDLLFAKSRANLVVFAYPACPCTRATLHELANVMAGAQSRISARVVFIEPTMQPTDWRSDAMIEQASSIAGVEVIHDVDGREAAKFGAMTSGWTELYAPDGRLVFAGGITAGRGHDGDNDGSTILLNAINGQTASTTNCPVAPQTTPVFGCTIPKPPEIR